MYIAVHEIALLEQLESCYRRASRTLKVPVDPVEDDKFRVAAKRAYGPLMSLEEQITEDEKKEMIALGSIPPGDEWKLSPRQRKIMEVKGLAGERIIEVLLKFIPPIVEKSALKPYAFVGVDHGGSPQLVMTNLSLPDEPFPELALAGIARIRGVGLSNNKIRGSRLVVSPWEDDWIGLMGATLGFKVKNDVVGECREELERLKRDSGFDKDDAVIGKHINAGNMSDELRKKYEQCGEQMIITTMEMLSELMSSLPHDSSAVQALYDGIKPLIIVSDRVEEKPLQIFISAPLKSGGMEQA